MRKLIFLTSMLLVLSAARLASADSLFLNAARSQVADSAAPAGVGSQPAPDQPAPEPAPTSAYDHAVPTEPGGGPAAAECPHCNSRNGSLGHYPGGCCERDVSCCADLWANYCRDKRGCTTAGSPRRHLGSCGLALPSFPAIPCWNPFHSLKSKHCHDESCDTETDCALTSDCASTDASMAPGETPDQAPSGDQVDEAATAAEAAVHKSRLPFDWKTPLKTQPSPYKTSPTARLKSFFSR